MGKQRMLNTEEETIEQLIEESLNFEVKSKEYLFEEI